MDSKMDISCHLCGESNHSLLLKVDAKPAGETDYNISKEDYYREVHQCNNCGVYFNERNKDLIPPDFYEGQYNAAITEGNLVKRFERITNLPFGNSDNKNRVLRIVNNLYAQDHKVRGMKALDIGSGTCVFLHEMKKFGFETYSLDPDPLSAKHSLENVKVKEAYCGTLDSLSKELRFDFISLNKVLEHVNDPVAMLKQASGFLAPGGILYVELPEGDQIVKNNNILNRAEFFIDHHTIFNMNSFSYLIKSAGLKCENIETITDPSGKFSIFGYCRI